MKHMLQPCMSYGRTLFRAMFLLATFIGLGLLACGREDEKARPMVVKVATVLPKSHPTAEALLHFQKRLADLSGGTMQAQVYFSSQLGDAGEVLELCRMGDVEMTQVSAANLTVYVPLANALAMPFIWKNSAHQARVLQGHVGEIIREQARTRELEIFGYFDSGTRNITTKAGPIRRPEDLRGMKIRVMNAPLMVETVNTLGASAVALNQGEVYTALQMGVVDGWENNPMTVATTRMFETGCVYYAWTRHFSIPDMLVAGGPFLRRLSHEQRQWVELAARETIAEQWRLWAESEEQALQVMRAGGMQFNDVQADSFSGRVKPIYDKYYHRYGSHFQQLCEEILGAS